MGFRVQRVEPTAEPTVDISGWDYADSFEVRLDNPDDHPADVWLRTAIAQAGRPLRRLIRLVHRHVVRFDLDATDRDGFLGWHQLVSERDVAAVEANGTLLRAVIVTRRHEPTRWTTSTYVFFHLPSVARLMWLAVRPIHLLVERGLVARAARALTTRQRGPCLVDPTRRPGRFRRLLAVVGATRAWLFFSRHVSWHVDPWLLRLSNGRVASPLVFPTGLLETHGARTGAVRRHAVIYFHDVEHDPRRVIVTASNAGGPVNPGWYYNILAHPEVRFAGVPMRAAVIDESEHDRLWRLADNVFPAFRRYRRTATAAGRSIPLVELTAADSARR